MAKKKKYIKKRLTIYDIVLAYRKGEFEANKDTVSLVGKKVFRNKKRYTRNKKHKNQLSK